MEIYIDGFLEEHKRQKLNRQQLSLLFPNSLVQILTHFLLLFNKNFTFDFFSVWTHFPLNLFFHFFKPSRFFISNPKLRKSPLG